MNFQLTLTNDPRFVASRGQTCLLYKRKDQQNAVLLDNTSPKYLLTTSGDGVSKVKICDAVQQVIAKVNRRMIFSDTLTLTKRNGGKPMKTADVLKQVPSTLEGQTPMVLTTEEGTYYWHQRPGRHWELSDSSNTPVAWTKTVPGPAPTWVLVLENRVMSLTDYILASLFYLKGRTVLRSKDGWESIDDHNAAWQWYEVQPGSA